MTPLVSTVLNEVGVSDRVIVNAFLLSLNVLLEAPKYFPKEQGIHGLGDVAWKGRSPTVSD
jgi:hypothetical protein